MHGMSVLPPLTCNSLVIREFARNKIKGKRASAIVEDIMLILIPWKPVAIFVLGMAAFIMFGYFASSFMQGKNPFLEDWNNAKQIAAGHSVTHTASAHKAARATPHPAQ